MNFLPFIITLLFIFGAMFTSFISNQVTDKTEALAYHGRLRALRFAYNEREEHQYNQYKNASFKKQSRSSAQKNSKTSTEEKTYFRVMRTGSIHGAINLAKLTEKNVDNDWLREKTITYLEAIYGKASFIQKLRNSNWASELLTFIITEQKKNLKKGKTFLPLDQLSPKGTLQEYYPRLIRGTNSCDPIKGKGYLPLNRCITFYENNKIPINIHFANPKLLTILIGEEGYTKVEQKEWPNGCPRKAATGESTYSLSKAELKKLLGDTFDPRLERNIDEKFYSRRKYNKKAFDPKTFISAQILEDSKPE